MDGGKHQVKSHRRASKWPICYNTTPESTRSWRHNQGAFLSRKCSLPCFQMTLILYPNLKSNMEPKVFGWDDSPENQGEKSQVVEKRFVFERSFSSGIHFFLASSTGRTHGPSPCGQAATWCPSGMEDEDEEWCLVGASNPPNGPPKKVPQMPSCHRAGSSFAGSNAGHENWGGSFWRSSCGWKRFEPWWSTVQGLQRQGAGMAWWRESSSLCWSGFGAVFSNSVASMKWWSRAWLQVDLTSHDGTKILVMGLCGA